MTTNSRNRHTWQDAIRIVLEDAGQPLHYQEILERIGEQGLRDLSRVAPASAVRSNLSQMVKADDAVVKRVRLGYFEFIGASSQDDLIDEDEIDESQETQADEDVREHLVPAYGLFWERNHVGWNSSQLLGSQASKAEPVNFAEQQGVYLLHSRRNVIYVGRAIQHSLYKRLHSHNRAASSKALRWDTFSWFGLRDIDQDTGDLKSVVANFSDSDLITILESVLIEALEPASNARRGDRMGELYRQVIDPQKQEQMRRDFISSMI